MELPICGPAFFTCALTRSMKLTFISEKISFGKKKVEVATYFILFYFKRENKTIKKTLKK